MKSSVLVLGLLMCCLNSSAKADETAELEQLMSYFGSTCPSQGQWTQTALGQAQSLVSTIQAIQNDPNCQTLGGALGQLQLLSQQIQRAGSQTTRTQIMELQKQEQASLLQLSVETDPTMIETIKTTLDQTEVTLAQAQADLQASSQIAAVNEGDALSSVSTSAQTLMAQIVANQSCLMSHPSVLSGVAALSGTVASGLATSGVSIGIAAGTQLLESVVEFIRQHRLAGQVNRISQSIAEAAFQCVLESLSDQYCSAGDALRVIDLKARSMSSPAPQDAAWVGASLLDHELPIFLSWLNQVRAGTDPTDDAEAARQQRIFEREAQVKSDRAFGAGVISENLNAFNQATTDSDKWVIELGIMNQLGTELLKEQGLASANGSTNPLLDIHDSGYAPYFLLGLTLDQAPRSQGAICSLVAFNPFQAVSAANPCGWPLSTPFKPDLIAVQTNLSNWVGSAEAKVDNELSTVLQSDPLQTIANAETPDIQGRSVTLAIQSLTAFLSSQRDSTAKLFHGRVLPLYDETIQKLNDVQAEISQGLVSTVSARAAIASIYSSANLTYGNVLFNARLNWAIRLSLNQLVTSGTGVDQSTQAELLAANDVVNKLELYSANKNLTEIVEDVKQSQRITQETLQRFTDVFGSQINTILGRYRSGQNDALASMCLKLLAVGTWPQGVSKNLCMGAGLDSIFTGGPSSIKISNSDFGAPLDQRACYYRDYLRRSQIYQDYLDRRNSSSR